MYYVDFLYDFAVICVALTEQEHVFSKIYFLTNE